NQHLIACQLVVRRQQAEQYVHLAAFFRIEINVEGGAGAEHGKIPGLLFLQVRKLADLRTDLLQPVPAVDAAVLYAEVLLQKALGDSRRAQVPDAVDRIQRAPLQDQRRIHGIRRKSDGVRLNT